MSDAGLAREAYEQTRRDYEAGKRSWVGDAWQFIEAFKAGFAAGQVAALETATISDLSDELVRRDDEHRARAAELSKEQHDQPDA